MITEPTDVHCRERSVFVVEPYIPNGGTFMAYHLGRIMFEEFGVSVVAVGQAESSHGVFDYDPVFPLITVEEFRRTVLPRDLLIANPSFSHEMLGLDCSCLKIMYVQGFNTFNIIDGRFDHYVCVSEFVRGVLAQTYGIDAPVVPPFIRSDRLPPVLPWRSRPAQSIVTLAKTDVDRRMLAHLRTLLARHLPGALLDDVIIGRVSQDDLFERIGQSRHLLTLSTAEGFGLIPLEAMAMGTTVIGFDGFGGRDYMRPGENCAVTHYPDIEGVAAMLQKALLEPNWAEALAASGRKTATNSLFTYHRFRDDWRRQFAGVLQRVSPAA